MLQQLQQAVHIRDKELENKSPFAYVNVIYWTGNIYYGCYQAVPYTAGGGYVVSENAQKAILSQSFDFPLVENASQWLVAVERFEINLNGVPFARWNTWDTVWIDRRGDDWSGEINVAQSVADRQALYAAVVAESLLRVAGQELFFVTARVGYRDVFSIDEYLGLLNALVQGDVNLGPLGYAFSMHSTGRIALTCALGGPWAAAASILYMSPGVKEVIGTFTYFALDFIGPSYYLTQFPRFDCMDRLSHLRIETNLSVTSDIAGSNTGSTLTDISVYQDQSISTTNVAGGGWTWNQALRQKIVYLPSYPRMCMMSDSAAIRNIRISVKAISKDGSEAEVPMPVGSAMNIKLSFTKRIAY